MKQLYKCNAYVYTHDDWGPIELLTNNEESIHIDYYYMLESYSSNVAVYDTTHEVLYLLPRWCYSMTTHQQLRKFVGLYCPQLAGYDTRLVREGFYHEIVLCKGYKFWKSREWREY